MSGCHKLPPSVIGRSRELKSGHRPPTMSPRTSSPQSAASSFATYLHLMDDHFKLGGTLCPGVDQLHSPVKVLYILAVHLKKRCQLLQDVSNAWVAVPEMEARADMVLLIPAPQCPGPIGLQPQAGHFYFRPGNLLLSQYAPLEILLI